MKKLLLIILFVSIFCSLAPSINAQGRLAECDACGYCQNREAPDNWNSCAQCLYKSYGVVEGTGATENKTLIIDPLYNRAPVPDKGKYFTQLGCLDVSAGSFSDPSAAGGLLNFLLNRLMFPIVGTLAFLAIVYGSFLLVTGQNNPEQIGRGKAWIYGAIVGVIFVLASVFIVQTIGSDILKIPGFSSLPASTLSVVGRRDGPDADKIEPPLVLLKINGQEVSRWTPNTTVTAASTDYRDLTYKFGDDIDLSTSTVSIVFTNDYCNGVHTCSYTPGFPRANTDVFINNFKIKDKICKQYTYVRPNSSTKIDDQTLEMFWTGEATCTVWE